ncbi:MAG TPA: rod shape-determining protein RodA [Mycobacteriales bacterium]|nr:rod shape-determining protein RodA [Mycobacteriales bacterium]
MSEWSGAARSAPASLRRRETSLRARALDRDSFLRQLDWVLVAAVAALCVLGCALVWAATKPQDAGSSYLKKDVLNILIGLGLAVLAALVDYRTLRAYTPVLYGASILGLLVVLTPLGSTINGAHSWIKLGGGFEIQPSEFAKVAVVLGIAMLLAEKREGRSEPTRQDILLCFGLAGFPVLLILAQPDVGSVMVFMTIIFGMIVLSGIPGRWVGGMLLLAVIGAVIVDQAHLLHQYQLARFEALSKSTNSAAAQTFKYNQQQAIIGIGHGGWLGQGLGHGSQTNGQFVPEQETDFVFSVAGEELGLLGAGLVIVLSGIVMWRALRIARYAQDQFGMLVSVGIVCWFAFQIFENVGMNLGIMPITGLPLPFVSYGGSSMFASMIAMGLLQNVRVRSNR